MLVSLVNHRIRENKSVINKGSPKDTRTHPSKEKKKSWSLDLISNSKQDIERQIKV